MLNILSNIFNALPLQTLFLRLANRYTGAGITLVLAELVKLNVIPDSVLPQIEGLPSSTLAVYLTIALGLWLIWHVPYNKLFKSQVQKMNEQVELAKLNLELSQINKQLKDLNNENK